MSQPIPIPCSIRKNRTPPTIIDNSELLIMGHDRCFPPPNHTPPSDNQQKMTIGSFENKISISTRVYSSSPSKYSNYFLKSSPL